MNPNLRLGFAAAMLAGGLPSVSCTTKGKAWDMRGKNMGPVKSKTGIGRNDPCNCGSGKKRKKCCGESKPVISRRENGKRLGIPPAVQKRFDEKETPQADNRITIIEVKGAEHIAEVMKSYDNLPSDQKRMIHITHGEEDGTGLAVARFHVEGHVVTETSPGVIVLDDLKPDSVYNARSVEIVPGVLDA